MGKTLARASGGGGLRSRPKAATFRPLPGAPFAEDGRGGHGEAGGRAGRLAAAGGGGPSGQGAGAAQGALEPRPFLGPPARGPFSPLFWLGGFPY